MGPDGLTMDESKVKAICDWLEPRNVKDIQSFLGLANFYRHFIHNFSALTVPLTVLVLLTKGPCGTSTPNVKMLSML